MTAPGEAVYLLTLRQYVPGTLSHFIAYYEQNGIQLALRRHGIDPLTHLLKLVQQAASALSAAHARGIVHGGLVPGNMLVDDQEHLWIADFGLTRLHPPPAPYLAPELYAASKARSQEGDMFSFWKTVTPASDQYALAVLCQQLFSHLLRPMDYEHLLPVLQCATHTRAGQRFASIDIFVHELMRQARRSYTPPPASVSTLQSQSDMHLPPQQIIPPTPPSPVDDWEKAGGKLFMSRDYNGALKAYLNALELDSSRSNLWLALGDAYFALENYTAALRAYEQAVRLNPNEASSWSNRGTALDALGRRKEAMECYERADQLNT
jgi:serine/threonine protein kinase